MHSLVAWNIPCTTRIFMHCLPMGYVIAQNAGQCRFVVAAQALVGPRHAYAHFQTHRLTSHHLTALQETPLYSEVSGQAQGLELCAASGLGASAWPHTRIGSFARMPTSLRACHREKHPCNGMPRSTEGRFRALKPERAAFCVNSLVLHGMQGQVH